MTAPLALRPPHRGSLAGLARVLLSSLLVLGAAGCDGTLTSDGPDPTLSGAGIDGGGAPAARSDASTRADTGGSAEVDALTRGPDAGEPGLDGRTAAADAAAPDAAATVPPDLVTADGLAASDTLLPADGPGPDGPVTPPDTSDPCNGRTAACARASVSGYREGDGLHRLDRCSFGLGAPNLDGSKALIDALAARLTPVTLAQVVADTNREARSITSLANSGGLHSGFRWNSGDDAARYWIPQGITGSGDGLASGRVGGRQVILVSWYFDPAKNPDDKRERGVRISFADVTDPTHVTYRHALLVTPSGSAAAPDFGAVNLHAGGIAWVGKYLYVADTGAGFRVFDLDRILRVPTDRSDLGFDAATRSYSAFGYKYVIPQVGRYRLQAESCKARFSFVSVDRSTSPPSLISGEYDSNSIYGKVYRWPLAPSGGLVATEGVVRPSEAFFAGQTRVQGATARDGDFWLSCSSQNPDHVGGLYRTRAGTASTEYPWPRGPEDLHVDPATDALWSVTEVGDRAVFSVPMGRVSR